MALSEINKITANSFTFEYGGSIYDNSGHNIHIKSGEDGATTQIDISIEAGGLYVNKRTRSSASASWGAWQGWTRKISW